MKILLSMAAAIAISAMSPLAMAQNIDVLQQIEQLQAQINALKTQVEEANTVAEVAVEAAEVARGCSRNC